MLEKEAYLVDEVVEEACLCAFIIGFVFARETGELEVGCVDRTPLVGTAAPGFSRWGLGDFAKNDDAAAIGS